MWKGKSMVLVGLLAAAMASGGSANAAQCGAGPAGFGACKRAFADEARTHGIGAKGVAALLRTTYSAGTIRADRGQKSFKLSLSAFMAKRGAATIVARGRSLKRANGALFASIERRLGF
jgi:membrane-bound lytic murein transglycosylase B